MGADHELGVRRSRAPVVFVLLETLTAAGLVSLASVVLAGAVWLPLGILGAPLLLAAFRSMGAIARVLVAPAPTVTFGREGLVIHHPELASPAFLPGSTAQSVWTGPIAPLGRLDLPGRTWLLGGVFPPDPKANNVVVVVLDHETDIGLEVRSRFPFAWKSSSLTATSGESTRRVRGLCIRTVTTIPPHLHAGEAEARPGSTMPPKLADWLKSTARSNRFRSLPGRSRRVHWRTDDRCGRSGQRWSRSRPLLIGT